MPLTATCTRCGLRFPSRTYRFVDSANITVRGNQESCPQCGGLAVLQEGTYSFIGEAVLAFRTADTQQLNRFHEIAAAAASGSLSVDDASRSAGEINSSFGELIRLAMQWGIPALLVAIVGLYLQWAAIQSTDRNGDELIQELRRQHQTNELILEQLQHLNEMQNKLASSPHSAERPQTNRKKSTATGGFNRHERRKAAVQKRKK